MAKRQAAEAKERDFGAERALIKRKADLAWEQVHRCHLPAVASARALPTPLPSTHLFGCLVAFPSFPRPCLRRGGLDLFEV